MKVVVLTGSTRGIGFGMAREFLKRGHSVVVCGRRSESTQAAVKVLAQEFSPEKITGRACDVGQFEQVQALWEHAMEQFGQVDIWINNAGLGTPTQPLWEQNTELMEQVVRTNSLGVMYCCKVALTGMLQQGFGTLYNMEGLGSAGPVVEGMGVYGSTKAGLTYLTKALVKATKNTPVQVNFLSPGMVVTELFTGKNQENVTEDFKKFANILADRVETVSPYLVEKILTNQKHGSRIAWLTTAKISWRFLTAPFRRNRDVFQES